MNRAQRRAWARANVKDPAKRKDAARELLARARAAGIGPEPEPEPGTSRRRSGLFAVRYGLHRPKLEPPAR